MSDAQNKAASIITRMLADEGKLLEAGWQVYRLLCLRMPPHENREDLQEAFMAGCEHTFASMIGMLDSEEEPTDADMQRMNMLHAELEPITAKLKLKYGRTAGRA
jgi:hypothetical protein